MTNKVVKNHKQFENEEEMMNYLINELNKDEKTIIFIKKRIAKFGFESVKNYSFRDTVYVKSSEKVIIYCLIHKKDFEITPHSFLSGCACRNCGKERMVELRFNQGKYHFETEMPIKHPTIKVLSTYKGTMLPIKVECLICGNKWIPLPNNLLRGIGCPTCHKDRGKLRFERYMPINQPNIKILSEYKNNCTPINVECLICGHKWSTVPHSFLQGKGCPTCANIQKANLYIQRGKLRFETEIPIIHPFLKILSEYKNNCTPIEVECLKCGHKWNPTPNRLLQGQGCPKCRASKGNKSIYKYLDEISLKYTPEFPLMKGSNPLRLDALVTIDNKKFGIEYDGEQHLRPVDFTGKLTEEEKLRAFNKLVERDKRKNQLCKEQNIYLIRIPFNDSNKPEDIRKNVYKVLDKELKKYIIDLK